MLRAVVFADVFPWPAVDGYRQRLAAFVEALASIGHVDFCVVDDEAKMVPPFLVNSVRVISSPGVKRPQARRAWRWLFGSAPRIFDLADSSDAADAFRAAIQPSYDVGVFVHVSAWYNFSELVNCPAIVDIDNLDSLMPWGPDDRELSSVADHVRRWFHRIDANRMGRAERECAANAAAVTLCSDLDVERSGLTRAHVVPNGSTQGWMPPIRPDHPDPPELLFVGLLSYPPNADAARWFATEVMPLIRQSAPDAVFRIVGRGGAALADLDLLPGVSLAGSIKELRPELDRACIAVVPIRFGTGTRLKVVEALANRLPLVTTSAGCEGIAVVDGVHALVADTVADLAEACVGLLGDPVLRGELAAQGERLWSDLYQWSTIHDRIAALARTVAGQTSCGAAGSG